MKRTLSTLLMSFMCCLVSLQARAENTDDQVRARAQALTAVMRELPGKADEAQRTAKLDGYFDFKSLTEAPIAAHAKAFKPGQRVQLEQVFNKLVRHLAYASGDSMRRGEVQVAPIIRLDGKQRRITDIAIKNPEDDVDDQISFVWQQRQGAWQVVDVVLDGASVVKDYENQFGKIIKKNGASGLLKKMQARLIQAEQDNKASERL